MLFLAQIAGWLITQNLIDSVVRIKKTGQFAIIKSIAFLLDKKSFLHYTGEIEGREGQYALYHKDIELECLPKENEKH